MGKKRKRHPSKLQETFHAFVDGSFFENKHLAGIGGTIIAPRNFSLMQAFSERLYGQHSSETAEIYAATRALSLIPANSIIILHSDFRDLCQKIKHGAKGIHDLVQKGVKKKRILAYADLFNEIARHRHVESRFLSREESSFMESAHHLARAGALDELSTTALPQQEKLKPKTWEERQAGKGSREQRRIRAVTLSIEIALD